ncbi:restriction endonuclease subunit S, partial [Escherichia coli]|uniref:restriction endonuclease subunit S n=1 Tax=Escherichia coli TaxID=562 RepID=UPI00142F4E5D
SLTFNTLPVLKIKNVANGDIHLKDVQYHLIDSKYDKYTSSKGDILITLTGNHPQALTQVVGAVSKQKFDTLAYINQRVAKIDPISSLAFKDFIYYFLKEKSTHDYLASQSSGSANQANISKADIENVELLLPPVTEQIAIASVLSSLDDKIDLLHHQNKTLESMAETLFRQWFDVDSNDEWQEKNVLDIFTLVGGGTPKTSVAEYWTDEIPWISGGDISAAHQGYLYSTEKSISLAGLQNSSAKLLPKNSTVISARGTVGKYALLARDMAFSQSNYGIVSKIGSYPFFIYLLVGFIVDDLLTAAYGSVFDTITTRTFESVNLKFPSLNSIEKFNEEISPIFSKKETNTQQIKTLENLRDTLLPKLMSGEVRVQYAEEAIASVA